MAQNNKDAYLEGYGWRALCRVHLAQELFSQAKNSHGKAMVLFESLQFDQEIVRTQRMLEICK